MRLTPEELSLEVGDSVHLEAEVEGEGNFDASLTWATSDAAVATVTDGRVLAKAAGTAEIMATSVADPEKSARARVRVKEPPPPLGKLQVTLQNFPNSLDAGIEVTGPGGYRTKLAGSELLEGLTPGPYYVNAQEVLGPNHRYRPPAAKVPVTVEADATAEVKVAYKILARFFEFDAEEVAIPLFGTASLRVDVRRLEDFDGEVKLRLEDLPPGISAAEEVVPAGADFTSFELVSTGEVRRIGRHVFRVVGEAAGAKIGTEASLDVQAIVNSREDTGPGTLRAYLDLVPELEFAGEALPIGFPPLEGTDRLIIQVESPLVVRGQVVIQGIIVDGSRRVEIQGQAETALLVVRHDARAEIRDLAFFYKGDPFSGAVVNSGFLRLVNTTHRYHEAPALQNRGIAEVERASFHGNWTDIGAAIANTGILTVRNSTFRANEAERAGGAIHISDGRVLIENVTFENNAAYENGGGAIYVETWIGHEFEEDEITLRIVEGKFIDNYGSGRGGAIENMRARVLVSSSSFSENESSRGGAISNNQGTMWLEGSTIAGNRAFRAGGGISNLGTLTVWNSTISGNTAMDGGGIQTGGFGTNDLHLVHGTVTDNDANRGGGIFVEGTTAIRRSIVFGNTSAQEHPDVSGSAWNFASGGHNFFGDIFAAEPPLTVPADRVGVDPLLFDLGAHDGPTQTHALSPASPAVDHVPPHLCVDPWDEPLSTDQRGRPRPAGAGCDSGAFELQSDAP